jgi:hypothetical protein
MMQLVSRSLIAFGIPALLVFGSAAAGLWNEAEAPVRPARKPFGDPGVRVAESAVALTAASPRALLDGVLRARQRGDRAWLARSLDSCADAPTLTSTEISVAWLRFEWPEAERLWDRIAAAEAAGIASIEIEAQRATATWNVGGAVGGLSLAFVQKNGTWRIADQ